MGTISTGADDVQGRPPLCVVVVGGVNLRDGQDRTGEVIGFYRLKEGTNAAAAWAEIISSKRLVVVWMAPLLMSTSTLILSMIAVSVVVFPLPVGAVSENRPGGFAAAARQSARSCSPSTPR